MTVEQIRALARVYGAKSTVRAVNQVTSLQGIPLILCIRCFEPELKTMAWMSDKGYLCRCCGRAERIMNQTRG